MPQLGGELSKVVQLKHDIDGGLEVKVLDPGRFLDFSRKNIYINAIWISFRKFLKRFVRIKFLRFESQLKN